MFSDTYLISSLNTLEVIDLENILMQGIFPWHRSLKIFPKKMHRWTKLLIHKIFYGIFHLSMQIREYISNEPSIKVGQKKACDILGTISYTNCGVILKNKLFNFYFFFLFRDIYKWLKNLNINVKKVSQNNSSTENDSKKELIF